VSGRPVFDIHICNRGFPGAVSATEEMARYLHPVADHFALAMFADWRDSFNGAFEAVEHVALSSRDELKALVVIVSANFALSHVAPPATRK
jgi:hypothetical protein